MKKLLSLIITLVIITSCNDKNKDYLITIHTSMGDMKVILFDETPLHKKNFAKLALEGSYDSTEWHRIIEGFMIQGGDVYAKNESQETESDRIPAEIVPGFYHTKGMLAAARQGDQVNPEKKSSGSQFYIIHGKVFSEEELTTDQLKLNQSLSQLLQMPEYDTIRDSFIQLQQQRKFEEMNQLAFKYKGLCEQELGVELDREIDPERLELYTTVGGAPHLDEEYTIFGKVVEGVEVVDKIAAVETTTADRPKTPIYLTMEVERVPKKEITKKYGYQYPDSE
jgi:peptidyl-prolyl cis-trans isomerase B (cyclophilin B)